MLTNLFLGVFMDTEAYQSNQNASSAEQHSQQSGGQAAQTAGGGTAAGNCTAPDMMTLLGQTSLPSGTCGWLSCLRKSGMSLTYSMEKRHIPDMDKPRRDASASCASGKNNQNGGQGDSNAQSDKGNRQTTGASDTMTCSGSCAIRYFDLAVGAILVLTVCGILKGCRHMKKWF